MGRNLLRRIRWANLALSAAILVATIACLDWTLERRTTPLPDDTARPLVEGGPPPAVGFGDGEVAPEVGEVGGRGEGGRGARDDEGRRAEDGDSGRAGGGERTGRRAGRERSAAKRPATRVSPTAPAPTQAGPAQQVLAPAPGRQTPRKATEEFGFEGG